LVGKGVHAESAEDEGLSLVVGGSFLVHFVGLGDGRLVGVETGELAEVRVDGEEELSPVVPRCHVLLSGGVPSADIVAGKRVEVFVGESEVRQFVGLMGLHRSILQYFNILSICLNSILHAIKEIPITPYCPSSPQPGTAPSGSCLNSGSFSTRR
jgi:hypothetical protein